MPNISDITIEDSCLKKLVPFSLSPQLEKCKLGFYTELIYN